MRSTSQIEIPPLPLALQKTKSEECQLHKFYNHEEKRSDMEMDYSSSNDGMTQRRDSENVMVSSYTLSYCNDLSPTELVDAHFRRSLTESVWIALAQDFFPSSVEDHFARSLGRARHSAVGLPAHIAASTSQQCSPQIDGSLTLSHSSGGPTRSTAVVHPIGLPLAASSSSPCAVDEHFFKSLGREWAAIVTQNSHTDYP